MAAIDDFKEKLKVDGTGQKTIDHNYGSFFRMLVKSFGIKMSATTKEFKSIKDKRWNAFLDNYAGSTHNKELVYVNRFRIWLKMGKLDRKFRKIEEQEPLDLDGCEDVYEKMYAACESDRDRCILALMRYGGLRIGEIVLLDKKNFKFYDDHVLLRFYRPKTKTWSEITLIQPVGIISAHLSHSGTTLFRGLRANPLTEMGLYKLVTKLAARCGIEWNPHKFRHVRATELGKDGLSKWDLDNVFGWSKRGNTASIYVNLSNEETMKKMHEKNGVVIDEVKPRVLKRCQNCNGVLQPGEPRCTRCGMSTNAKESIEIAQKQREYLESFDGMSKDQMIAVLGKAMAMLEGKKKEI